MIIAAFALLRFFAQRRYIIIMVMNPGGKNTPCLCPHFHLPVT